MRHPCKVKGRKQSAKEQRDCRIRRLHWPPPQNKDLPTYLTTATRWNTVQMQLLIIERRYLMIHCACYTKERASAAPYTSASLPVVRLLKIDSSLMTCSPGARVATPLSFTSLTNFVTRP